MSANNAPLPVVFGLAGLALAEDERAFFAQTRPLGFILFARNIDNPAQTKALVAELRACVGRPAPILIDQEGGRVQRLKPPHWRRAPCACVFGRMPRDQARRALRLNTHLMAAELAALGIDVDCTPVVDVPVAGAHDVIGDRALSFDPALVAELGREVVEGMLDFGVLPVVKHIPGHGRAMADSHKELPRVETSLDGLRASDFVPFRALADAPWAMIAHVLYTAVDATLAATVSPKLVAEVIRGEIGFDGVLVSDDVCMKALSPDVAANARDCLAAGCDVALHCSGNLAEMRAVAACVARDFPAPTAAATARLARAEAAKRAPPPGFSAAGALAELDALLAPYVDGDHDGCRAYPLGRGGMDPTERGPVVG